MEDPGAAVVSDEVAATVASDWTPTIASEPVAVAGGFEMQVKYALAPVGGEQHPDTFTESCVYDGTAASLATIMSARIDRLTADPLYADTAQVGDVIDLTLVVPPAPDPTPEDPAVTARNAFFAADALYTQLRQDVTSGYLQADDPRVVAAQSAAVKLYDVSYRRMGMPGAGTP